MIKEAWIYAYEFVSHDELVYKLRNINIGISYWSSGYASMNIQVEIYGMMNQVNKWISSEWLLLIWGRLQNS
jgi:hypothetical protein